VRYQSVPTVVNGGSLGASRTEALSVGGEKWLTGTLTANHTLTVTPATAGRLRFFGLQDATGGRTLTVSDGTNTQALSIPLTAGVQFEVVIYSTDGSSLLCEVFSGGPGLLDPIVAPFDVKGWQFGGSAIGANVLVGARVRIPYTGRLRDLYTFVATTAAANAKAAVYDTGQSVSAKRTALWTGASVALPGSNNNWLSLGDPNLAVTAGQQLDLALICDNGTATFQRNSFTASNMTPLPTVFQQAGTSVRPLMAWTNNPGSFTVPATLDDATVPSGASNMFLVVGRIA
jgi:hypothetical protein